ncbi:MAG: flagellar filament capping protein FliD [Pseudomonadota bacterium]
MISSLGVGSGLDLNGLLDQLVAAERAPTEQRLAIREAGLQAQFSAFGSLSAAVQSIRDAASKLAELSASRSATVSGAVETVTVSAAANAALGDYAVRVDQLASSQTLASDAFSASDALVGAGTLTISFGATDYDPDSDIYTSFTADSSRPPVTIEIGPGDQTLSSVRDAINEANAGVTASIVTDSTGPRLVLSSGSSGAEGTLEITVDDDDGNDTDTSGLSALAFSAAATNLTQTVAGQDAAFTVNGLSLTSANNSGITAVEGLTIDLTAVSADEAVIRVRNRESDITGALNEFADAYNALLELNGQLAAYDPDSGQSTALFGDTTLRGLMNSLRSELSNNVLQTAGQPASLIDMAFDSGEGGRLSVNSERLNSFLDEDFSTAVDSLNALAESYVERTDTYLESGGLLAVRTEGIQTRLDEISDERLDLNVRIDNLQQRLTRQFASLDTLLANLRSTSDFITNQLSNLSNLRTNQS